MQVTIPSFGSWKVESCSVPSSWQGTPMLLEKQVAGLGSSLPCRAPIRAKLQSSRSPKDHNGDAAPQFSFHPLFAHSLSFLKKFSPGQLARQLHSPSLLVSYAQPRPRRRAILSVFNYPRKWLRNPRDPSVGGKLVASRRLYHRVSRFFRSSVWIAAILLVGGGLLYGQSKAQDYLQAHIVPSLAVMVGAHLQRQVELGKVGSLSPLGFRLGPSSVGTHEAEFSCGEIPAVDIKFRPLASIRSGQLVVDAVLAEPNLLVAQKEDWSWLGIPSASEKKNVRSSSEVGLDERTMIRRLAREQVAQRLARDRNIAARKAAEHGYRFHDCSDPPYVTEDLACNRVGRSDVVLDAGSSKVQDQLDEKKKGRTVALEVDGVASNRLQGGKVSGPKLAKFFDESEIHMDEKGNVAVMGYLVDAGSVDQEKLRKNNSSGRSFGNKGMKQPMRGALKDFEGLKKAEVDQELRVGGSQDEGHLQLKEPRAGSSTRRVSVRTSLQIARSWINGQFLRPVRQVLLKKWARMELKPSSKAVLQRKNLDRSAAAAKSFFQRLDEDCTHQTVVSEQTNSGRSLPNSPAESNFVTGQMVLPDQNADERFGNERIDLAQLTDHSHERWSTLAPKQKIPSQADHLDPSNQTLVIPNWDQQAETGVTGSIEGFGSRILAESEKKIKEGWSPVALETVYFKNGNLTLLAYGDTEPRVFENVNGHMKLGSDYQHISAYIAGRLGTWKTEKFGNDGGRLIVKVDVDLVDQAWDVKVKGHHLFAPLLERLLEIPIDWSQGRATGEVHLWMAKEDVFPNFGGRIDVKDLDFHIWEAPSEFKGVGGTLCFQGQRLFFHNASGWYGSVPLSVSGDFDLNPEDGEYRLSCQIPGVEANALMKTLKAQPPPYPLAGTLKAVVYCRGPLDAPIFEGTAETVGGKQIALTLSTPPTLATVAVEQNQGRGAVAAYDRVPFSSCFASFTFNTDDCVADLYGIRATPLGGGEIRGAGTMWICPEGEVDPEAVRVDCSGHFSADSMLRYYVPAGVEFPPVSFGPLHGEAKIRGSILMPIFDIKWETPKAQGSLDGAHGDISVSREALTINASAFAFDLFIGVHTAYPPITRCKPGEWRPSVSPSIEGLDIDVRLRGFDIMSLSPSSILPPSISPGGVHMKVTGKVKFQGRVPQIASREDVCFEANSSLRNETQFTRLVGDVTLSGLKLNQLLVAPHLTGSLDMSPYSFKLRSAGRVDEHLNLHVLRGVRSPDDMNMQQAGGEAPKEVISLSLQRGQLHMGLSYRPEHSAKLEIRNLLLDELEFASLRGAVPKAEVALNLQKRRGQGSFSVRRPRFSGLQGESLDVAARWSGDVVTLEKSVLEQATSRYELQGEYVLPRPRSTVDKGRERAMGGQLGSIISAMGRWRLRLDVPRAEISELLPVARLLSRSSDPAVVSRSKELFLQGVQKAGFSAVNLKQQLEYIRKNKVSAAPEDFSPESMPLPGLAELKGLWHGSLEASGGGNGDTTADFDLRGEDWEWGAYKTQKVTAIGDYSNNDGLRLENFFIQKDAATLHADGTLLGPKPNLHFAVLNFPIGLVPPLLHAFQSAPEPLPTQAPRSLYTPIKGILYMEGDLRGHLAKPQCDVQIRLLDGAVGGLSLGRAEVAASITSANRLAFNAVLEPATHTGHVRVRGSLPMGQGGLEEHEEDKDQEIQTEKHRRTRGRGRERNRDREEDDGPDKRDEGWEVRLAESLKALDGEFLETGAVQVDAAVKDGGMMLITAISPGLNWLQGNADITLKVRGTVSQPVADGVAAFQKVAISSPVLPRPLTNLGGTISLKANQLCVESLEGRIGRRGHLQVKGKLPFRGSETPSTDESIEVKAEALEVRSRNAFSGQVDSQIKLLGSLFEPEVTGVIKLSHGEVYLSQEKGANNPALAISSPSIGQVEEVKEKDDRAQLPIAVRLKALKLQLGPELRMVYPLILNFAVSGELELNGFADPQRVKPKGTLTFENGDVNLVATQVRLNRDHPNRAKFEPEQGLDPSLDLALVGADWQLKVQGRARNWQDNLVITSTRSGEQDAFTRIEAARVFESQLAESLLEGDGQLAFKKLAAATVETLMPKIEGKGEFGQARWRLVSAPQIPNLLSLDPTTDPFKSLANLSFGTEVEVQLGKHLQASVVRQLKESEMATQWTLLYQLNSKLRLLFSSIPSVDNRILFEYSATSQN